MTDVTDATFMQEVIDRSGIPGIVQGQGSMFQVYFTELQRVRTYREAMQSDRELFSRFAHEMIYRGVFVHPDVFEHWFLSAAHTQRALSEAAASRAR